MKVLVNGGLNLSERDGWWEEAYAPDVGWAMGNSEDPMGSDPDALQAIRLYDTLEHEIIREFYDRDASGIPRDWLKRVRNSMARLTPSFSSNRMMLEYIEKFYIPAAKALRRRAENGGKLAVQIEEWHEALTENWRCLRFGQVSVANVAGSWHFEAQVFFGDLDASLVEVQIYADPEDDGHPIRVAMDRKESIHGTINAFLFRGEIPSKRPQAHFTLRIIPRHPEAVTPSEMPMIVWQS